MKEKGDEEDEDLVLERRKRGSRIRVWVSLKIWVWK